MASAGVPSEKLKIDFGWLLNRVADYLSRVECSKIARAEQLPQSMCSFDSEDFQVILLHTLQGRGKFSPLYPDGLIEILKKVDRMDAIREVEKYKAEQRYIDEKKIEKERFKKEKRQSKRREKNEGTKGEATNSKPQPDNMEEVEKLLALARTKTFSLIEKGMRALDHCASQVEQYREDKIDIEELKQSFKKFSQVVERSGRTMQKALSGSSLKSKSSGSSIDGNPDSPVGEQDTDWYSEIPALHPVQETAQPSPEVSRRHRKPQPLPRTKKPQPLTTTPQFEETSAANLTPVETDDFTGGTGDSGVGSGGSNREEWIIKDSTVFAAAKYEEENQPKPVVILPADSQHYTPLLARKQYSEGYAEARPTVQVDQ